MNRTLVSAYMAPAEQIMTDWLAFNRNISI